jgi:hypothetical protein
MKVNNAMYKVQIGIMKNIILGIALTCFVIAVVSASYQWHMAAFLNACAAALWFLMYKNS